MFAVNAHLEDETKIREHIGVAVVEEMLAGAHVQGHPALLQKP
jgi:hypothetical protein